MLREENLYVTNIVNRSKFSSFHCKWADGKGSDYLITIATSIKTSRKQLVDVMLHEMIHLWQAHMADVNNDEKYLDRNFLEYLVTKEANERGHGKHFKSEMDRLNSYGFNVTVIVDGDTDINLVETAYGIAFLGDHDAGTVLWSFDDIRPKVDDLNKQIQNALGEDYYNEVITFTTKDSLIMHGIRVTKAGKLPKNVLNIRFLEKFIHKILDARLTKVDIKPAHTPKDKKPGAPANVPPEVIALLPGLHKYRTTSFDSYLQSVVINLRQLFPDTEGYGENIKGVDREVIDYVKEDWKKIKDPEIKKSSAFKYFLTYFKIGLSGKREIDPRGLRDFKKKYEDDFAERVDKETWGQLFVEYATSKISAEIKKRTGKAVDKKIIKKLVSDKFDTIWP